MKDALRKLSMPAFQAAKSASRTREIATVRQANGRLPHSFSSGE
jgi:hypothetical protein